MSAPALRPLSTGEILDVSFGLYRQRFATLVMVTLVTSGVPLIINTFVTASGGLLAHLPLFLGNVVLSIVMNSIASAATVFIISESYLGHELAPREAFSRATPFIGRLIVLGLLSGLVIGVGFLLLFVPGLILTAGLIVSIPALVLENQASPLEAMGRAWGLSRGQRGKVLGVVMTVMVIIYVPAIAIGGLLPLFVDSGGLEGLGRVSGTALVLTTLAGILQLLIFPLLYCALTVTYYDLRIRREGFDLEILAARLNSA
jgi:hypothetical protein